MSVSDFLDGFGVLGVLAASLGYLWGVLFSGEKKKKRAGCAGGSCACPFKKGNREIGKNRIPVSE